METGSGLIVMTGAEGINFNTIRIDSEKCNYCMKCIINCQYDALTYDSYGKVFMHNPNHCSYDKKCEKICNNNAIKIYK